MTDSAPAPRRILLIAGMHRSGTSALTGALVTLGAGGPIDPMPPTPHNPRGYWESARLCRFHDRVLDAAGSGWDDLAPIEPSWFASEAAAGFGEELREILSQSYPASGLVAVKDPRLCRLLPLWLRQGGEDAATMRVLLPLRNPLDVARSLEARDGMPLRFGALLWLRNVLDAEASSRGLRRGFLLYEALVRDWRNAVDAALDAIDLDAPAGMPPADDEAIVDARLQRWSAPLSDLDAAPEIASWVRAARATLWPLAQGAATRAELDAAHARLDTIAAGFDAACAAFGPLLREARMRTAAAEAAATAERLRRERVENERDHALLAATPLFDAEWYRTVHSDVPEAMTDPVGHFLRHGAAGGCSPGPQFDGPWYLVANPDVAAARLNPLVHYLRYGQAEGRPVRPQTAGEAWTPTRVPALPGPRD